MRITVWVGLLLLGFGGYTYYYVTRSLPDLDSLGEISNNEAVEQETAETIVQEYLRENRVVIFSKSYCGFSKRAKNIMEAHLGARYTAVELDTRPDGSDIQDYLLELTGGRTVPRVFVDNKFIGGADDTAALDRSGRLGAMLKERGIL